MSNALNTKYSSLIEYNGKKLFDSIQKGASLNEVLCQLEDIIKAIETKVDLSCVDLSPIGIKISSCTDEDETVSTLCDVLNQLGETILATQETLTAIQIELDTTSDPAADSDAGKVALDATDTPGYLEAKLTSDQDGTLENESGVLKLRGFVPIGFKGFYSGTNKFDVTGKGLVNTDAYGWAICNGNNGTEDCRGLFVQATGTLLEAGTTGGSNAATVTSANISSMSLPVTGSVDNALSTPHSHAYTLDTISLDTVEVSPGTGLDVVAPEGAQGTVSKTTATTDLTHTHSVSLTATHTNATPTPLDITPSHIKLVMIERIF